jgi:regulator of protease activity HflC (stomatin/prohibitin superfamily)
MGTYRTGTALGGVVVIGAVIGIAALIGAANGFTSTDAGFVAVVRDGGPMDDSAIRTVLDPATGPTWTGLWSTAHPYPAQQRIYTITSDPKRATGLGVDHVVVPSGDGVDVGVEGTLYYAVNRGHDTLKAFDDRYGNRTYLGEGDDRLYAWEGDEGWAAFFAQAVRPVIYNTLRVQIGSLRCAELVPTCALLDGAATPALGTGNANLARVQQGVNASLEREIQTMLGGPYLTTFRFNLVRLTLPQEIQNSVAAAQGAQAAIRQAEAKTEQAKVEGEAAVVRAKAEAKANKARQQGYKSCRACIEIDKITALPNGITVYAPGNPAAVDASPK